MPRVSLRISITGVKHGSPLGGQIFVVFFGFGSSHLVFFGFGSSHL